MPESFGARLRQQREARQIDLVAISEQTKIKLALLEALEHDDVSHWPSGIFRRAYIRAYAQFIGLDPDACCASSSRCIPIPATPSSHRSPAPPQPRRSMRSTPPRCASAASSAPRWDR